MRQGNLSPRLQPTTLSYNDVHWTNLALSREDTPALRAIVFDDHLLEIGPAYGDYHNVRGALGESARMAFECAYVVIDEREAALDAPTSVLYALHIAVQRPQLPRGALPLVRKITIGELEAELRRAILLVSEGASHVKHDVVWS